MECTVRSLIKVLQNISYKNNFISYKNASTINYLLFVDVLFRFSTLRPKIKSRFFK